MPRFFGSPLPLEEFLRTVVHSFRSVLDSVDPTFHAETSLEDWLRLRVLAYGKERCGDTSEAEDA